MLPLLLFGCMNPPPCVPAATAPTPRDLATLPGLAPGNHLGLWPTYERLPATERAAVDSRWQRAVDAGMDIARVHVSWGDLERWPGRYQLDDLQGQLAEKAGFALQVLIETVDSDGYALPKDLMDEGYVLADGRAFDDPVITDRFACLLDVVMPELVGQDVFAISVANEPDALLDDIDPTSAEGLAWVDQLAAFTAAARDHVHGVLPEAAVGMTLRESAIANGITTLGPVIEASDVAVWNTYCQGPDWLVQPATAVPTRFDAMIAASAGRPIVLQEFGCPSGSEFVGGSEAIQADYYAAIGEQFATRPELRAGFAFQLIDWSPKLAAQYGDAIVDEGYPDLADLFVESLTTLGLLRWEDGSERPAWDAFEASLRAL